MSNKPVLPVFDGHNDTLLMTYLPGYHQRPFLEYSDQGHIDLPRARTGGFVGGLFAIFVQHPKIDLTDSDIDPDDVHKDPKFRIFDPVPQAFASKTAKKAIENLYLLEEQSSGGLRVSKTVAEIIKAKDEGELSAVLHFEGAEPINSNLDNLEEFYDMGLRSVGIVWSRPNEFGHGVNFNFPGSPDTGPGLTEAGKRLVRRCNDMGILVDLSHLTEKGFYGVEKITDKPLVATHSCVHAICPTPRNLTDNQLDAIAASNGLVGINFSVSFLRKDGRLDENTPLSDMTRHFRYIADRIGVKHLAFGSDFDGALVPAEIGDVAGLPVLVNALREAGFDDEELEAIAWKNWMRVLGDTWI